MGYKIASSRKTGLENLSSHQELSQALSDFVEIWYVVALLALIKVAIGRRDGRPQVAVHR